MKNLTTLLIFLFLPFYSFLNAQCFDLSSFDLFGCAGEQLVFELNIEGGEAPYTVEWDTGFSQGTDIVNEQNGTWNMTINQSALINFTVTDNTGCEETATGTIETSDEMIAGAQVTDVSCGGNCDGFAFIFVTGGTPPYTYTTSTGWNGPQIPNLCPGIYIVDIVDALGCWTSIEFVINEANQNLAIEINEVIPVSCIGSNDGAIDIEVIGGTGGFSYFWTGPNGFIGNSQNLTNLPAGTYILEVVDANGCITEFSVDVPEPSLMEIIYTNSGLTCNDEGFIEILNVEGGTPPFTYSLDGGSFTSETLFDNLIAGTYTISVIDNSGCIQNEIVLIESEISMEITTTFSNCDSLGGIAIITDIVGTTIADASFIWSNGTVGPSTGNLAPGGYSVTVTDNNTNCSTHQNVEVLYDPFCFVRISGTILNDFDNEDCVEDANSFPAQFILVSLSNGDLTFTDENGYYEFETTPGSYEISIDLGATFFEPLCTEPINVEVANFGEVSTGNDFWVTYPNTQDLAVHIFAGAVRPGFDQTVIVHASNLSGFPMDGTITFMHDAVQTFNDASPSGSYDMASATISWDYENLTPGEIRSFVVYLDLPASTALGTPITYVATVGPEENDIDLTNNINERNLIVTGSYDPNDKQVTPRGEEETGNITRADSLLTYQVRFQNTGTDTAFTVVILDEISDELDISTVRPGASSHPYRLNIIDGKTLEFRFEDILLPDSFVNEPASNGYVLFDIKTKKDLPYGTTFENTAEIYFDFNEAIITNTTINTLANPVAVNDLENLTIPSTISPNPGGEESVFFYTLEEPTMVNLDLYDLNGKLMRNFINKKQKASGTHQVNLADTNLPKGVYLLHLETEEGGIAVRKWVKM